MDQVFLTIDVVPPYFSFQNSNDSNDPKNTTITTFGNDMKSIIQVLPSLKEYLFQFDKVYVKFQGEETQQDNKSPLDANDVWNAVNQIAEKIINEILYLVVSRCMNANSNNNILTYNVLKDGNLKVFQTTDKITLEKYLLESVFKSHIKALLLEIKKDFYDDDRINNDFNENSTMFEIYDKNKSLEAITNQIITACRNSFPLENDSEISVQRLLSHQEDIYQVPKWKIINLISSSSSGEEFLVTSDVERIVSLIERNIQNANTGNKKTIYLSLIHI